MKHNFFKFLLAGMMLLGTSINLWAGEQFNGVYATYTLNGENKATESWLDEWNLGTISSNFTINETYYKVSYWDWSPSMSAQLYYNKDGGTGQYVGWTNTVDNKGNNNYEVKNTNVNAVLASYTESSGSHTIYYRWETYFSSVFHGIPDNKANCKKFTYTILPPTASLSITPSGNVNSGKGTSSDPYIVSYNKSLTLTASSEQAHTDANSAIYYTIDGGSESSSTKAKTINNVTTQTVESVTFKVRCKNTSAKINSGYTEQTVYYKAAAVYSNLSISDAGASMTTASSLSDDHVEEGKTVTITKGTPVTGYEFDKYTYSTGSSISGDEWKPSASDQSVTVNWKAKQFSITYKDQGDKTFSGTHETGYPKQHTYDQTTTLKTATKTGYTFQGWHKKSDCSDEAVITIGAQEITANLTLYAKWEINTYNIIHTQGEHYTVTNLPATKVYQGSVAFTATPDKGYLLTVTATKGGATFSLSRNGNTYSFNMPAGDVTISVTPHRFKLNMDQDIEFDENWQARVHLNGTHDYTFKLHNAATGLGLQNNGYFGNSGAITSTITSPWTMEDNVSTKCTVKTGVEGDYIFTYTEDANKKPQILVTYPNVSKMNIDGHDYEWALVSGTTYQTATFTLAKKLTDYAFNLYWEGARLGNDNPMDDGQHGGKKGHTGWEYESTKRGTTNLYTTDVANGKYSFHFDANTKKLTAIYPSVIAGGFPNHSWDGEYTLNFDGNVGTVNIVLDPSSPISFKVVDDGQFYGKQGVNIISTTTVTGLTKSTESSYDMNFTPNTAGIYTFTYNRSDHSLTVTYPTSTQTYDVTVYADGITPTTVNVGSDPAEITAIKPQSMVFDKWVKEGETSNVTIADESSEATTITATGAGASVRATFKTQNTIYFKDNAGWGDVWLHFYKDSYWNETYGSGSLNILHSGMHANKIGKTDVWYFDKSSYSDWTSGIMAFTNIAATGHDNFFMVNCSYFDGIRGLSTFDDRTPLFVPRNYITDRLKSSQYYLEGIWMKYNSTESGFDLRGQNVNGTSSDQSITWIANKHKFTAPTPGEYTFSTTLHLLANQTYEMKIYDAANREYSHTGNTMTSTSCTGYKLPLKTTTNFKVQTTAAGDYVFTISVGGGEMLLSITYPLSDNDYRVIYYNGTSEKDNGYIIKYVGETREKKDTASFFIASATGNVKLQKCTNAANQTWEDVAGQSISLTNYSDGVYNFIVSQNGSSATLTAGGEYTGKFYIRTDGVDGGWESFKTNADNVMTDFGSELDAGVTYGNFKYDYYKTKWVHSGKNVKFRIANDYSKAISEDFAADAIINNKETLPQDANVRFMWNSKTNELKRAYISGSTNISDRFLVLEGDTKMFDKDGNALNISGLKPNEINFDDKNNWVYQADIKAQPGCAVKLTAKYNKTVQYFIGTSSESKTIIDGTSESPKQYSMRAVYDFKTNRLTAGWIPDGTQIDDELKLGGDLLLVREGQDDVQQITFGTNGKVTDIQHIYSVLTIKKEDMIGTTEHGYEDRATNEDYAKTMYWVSFPFAVKVSEIFGVDGYGTKWIMQKYNGEKRAQIGWFTSQTSTFWEFIDESETLEAYKGYLFLINANYFNTSGADVWKNSATEANFYFPSTEDEIGIIKADTYDQPVHVHACEIDQEFTGKSGAKLNHKITDSYWNVIGVPVFQNAQASATLAYGCTLKSYYKWKSEDNTYEVETTMDGMTFKTMHAYMVQFGGTLTWSNVSVVSNPAQAPYAYADDKNYRIELFFNGNGAEDHTYINLADGASTDFVLNEDMMKIDNAGQPNIYSFAGAYDVAYNETTFDNQTVMLGVSAPKNGSYTFAMPKDFSGKAVLVDLESGEATDLNLSNYTVELNKGTYNNRFQLLLEVEAQSPTNMNPTKGEWSVDGKTKKLFINDNIYLINAGRIYNASGTKVR